MSRTTSDDGTEQTLTEEMRGVEAEFPEWHLFATDTVIWAVTSHTPCHGCGLTLDAPTPALMRHAIAAQQHRWDLGGGMSFIHPSPTHLIPATSRRSCSPTAAAG